MLLCLLLEFPKLVVIYLRHSAMAPGVGRDCRGHFNEDSCHGNFKSPNKSPTFELGSGRFDFDSYWEQSY